VASVPPSRGSRRHLAGYALFALLPVLLLLPFIDKPFNIDDPPFVYSARQIASDPARPLDFPLNWHVRTNIMWNVTNNPPFLSYVLAAAFGIARESERVAHLALLPFAMAASVLAFHFARRFTKHPSIAAALFVLSPAFLVSATTVMADVPALALLLGGIAPFANDERRPTRSVALVAGALLGLAALTKYQGMLGLAVVAAAALRDRGRRAALVWCVAAFLLVFGAWFVLGIATHGSPHFLDTIRRGGQTPGGWHLVRRAVSSMTFSIGALVSLFALIPVLAFGTRRAAAIVKATLAAAALGCFLYLVVKPAHAELAGLTARDAVLAALLFLVAFVGMALSARAVRGEPPILLCWAAVVPIYVVLCGQWVAVRYLLPGLLPIVILMVRGIEASPLAERRRRQLFAAAAVATGAIGLTVAEAESHVSRFARDGVADALTLVPAGSRVLFDGHWGFQYYMEKRGVRALEIGVDDLRSGDYVIAAEQTHGLNLADYPGVFSLVKVLDAPPGVPIVTMARRANAGFHADLHGILPFAISTEPPDRIAVVRVN